MTGTAPVESRRLPREIWVLAGAAFAIAVGYGLVSPVLPGFAAKFSTDTTAATVVVSAFAAFRLIWAPAAGGLVQRLGERRIYLIGLVCVALSSAATAFAASYWQLLVFRSLGGIGSVMFTVAASGLMVKLAPAHLRGKTMAVYSATFLVGSIAGPVLGGTLAGAGLQIPFLVYAATLIVVSGAVALLLPKVGGAGIVDERPVMTFREAFSHRAYRAALCTGFAFGWANFGVRVSLVPLFVAQVISTDPMSAGLVLAAFAVGNAGILPVFSRLSDTIGRRPLIIFGAITSGVLTASLGLSTGMGLLLGLSVVAGIGTGMLGPGQQAALADIVGSERSAGQVLAAYQMVQDIGSIVGPLLAAMVADQFGFGWAFAVSGLALIIAAVPWLRTGETLRRETDKAS